MKLPFVFPFLLCSQLLLAQPQINVQQQFTLAMQQYERMLAAHPDIEWQPFTSKPDGSLKDAKSEIAVPLVYGIIIFWKHCFAIML